MGLEDGKNENEQQTKDLGLASATGASYTSGDSPQTNYVTSTMSEVHQSPRTPQKEEDGERPRLPTRSSTITVLSGLQKAQSNCLDVPQSQTRPQLQSGATTGLSLTDIQTHSHTDGSRETYASSTWSSPSHKSLQLGSPSRRLRSYAGSDLDDGASVRGDNSLPTGGDIDAESILGNILVSDPQSPAWMLLQEQSERPELTDPALFEKSELTADFYREFDEIGELADDGSNEQDLLERWSSKYKHFLILSAAGKPIYNRHGDKSLISNYIGVIQTIISFYEDIGDRLKTFTAGEVRFVIMSRGPLHLVATSRLGESHSQLRIQLEALYMQILSTLTLPILSNLFSKRPSTDLGRPLQGTEALLSALADQFTRGSPSALLSSLECLKLKNHHRQAINNTLLRARCKDLLYGMIVAGGRLVSVVRPRTHSLHPGDLQLIFNMLFEAGGVRASEGENWIPICLPGFNKTGYLHMYVSFLDVLDEKEREQVRRSTTTQEDRIAILLLSTNRESFYELRNMRDVVVEELEQNGQMNIIKSSVIRGRPNTTDIIPGTVLQHFLYKSRANLQYVAPSYDPHFNTLLERRRLLSLYHTLHATVHSKMAHLRVHHCVSREFTSLGWVTPIFELYCVAGPSTTRNALAQNANKLVQWIRNEEERVFIIGGAIF